MLVLLSPAKSLDYDSPLATRKHSQPRLLAQSAELIEVLRTLSAAQIARLMGISAELAHLNLARYEAFDLPFTTDNARPAVLAFNGDVYQGLQSPGFGERDFTEAQKTVRILSGLYGVLRPLDLMQPYRLEMGTTLSTAHGKDLYQFWGDRVTELLAADLAESPGPAAIINLASQEYFKVVRPEKLAAEIISPRFEQINPAGQRRFGSFAAKRARGTMTRWLVTHRIRSLRRIVEFDLDGYRYDPATSCPTVPVFVRAR